MACALVLSWSDTAAADDKPRVRLSYRVAADVTTCPGEDALRDAVAGRLGYDGFNDEADDEVRARIRRRDDGLVGTLVVERDGVLSGSREITSASGDCEELFSAMSLAISIAIDPLTLTRPVPKPPKPPPCPTCECPTVPVPEPPAPPPLATEPSEPGPAVRTSLGILTTLGSAPGVAVGLLGQVGARWPVLSLNVEGRVDFATSGTGPNGDVESALMLASAVPCGHYAWFLGCGLVSLGVARAGLAGTEQNDTTFFFGVGARAGAELKLFEFLHVRPHLDVMANTTRMRLRLDGEEQWRTPPLQGSLGVSAVGDFL